MKKIKVLEVNNYDLPGKRFNGYDMIQDIADENIDIKQAVIYKESDNKNVVKILNNQNHYITYETLESVEREQAIHNVFSITTSLLHTMKEYQEADIIHFHMFHNTKLSIYGLKKIASEKKVILSIHDPWFLTGRCVHFYECNKWQKGCQNCHNLNNMFPLLKDNCSSLWNLKKQTFADIDVDLVCSSDWMLDMVKSSPILKNQTNHKIPLGIDYKKFSSISYKDARKKLGIEDEEIVLFFRAQNEFKGTPYIVEAMKMLNTKKKITLMTCDNEGLINDLEGKYKIIELGKLKDKEMICAMNACDIFLMPSIGESFGMMAIEAMSCAKPVIVFNNSALPSVTHAPKCGYLVNDKDSTDLMKAIKYLSENEKERLSRGKLGQKIVKEEYDINEYNSKIKDLYISVSKRKHKVPEPQKLTDNDNTNKLKAYLNKLTIRLFGNNKKITNDLLYQIDKTKLDKEQIKYDDINVHIILEDYMTKLEKIINTEKNIVKSNSKLRRIIFYLIHDKQALLDKFSQRFKKKD